MFLRWCTTGVIVATVALSTMRSVASQDSFLDGFRTVRRLDPAQKAASRPEFLLLPHSSSDVDTQSDSDADHRVGPPEIVMDESASELRSASREIGEHCAEADCDATLDCELPLVRTRDASYQGSQFNYGMIFDDASSGLSIRSLDTYATFAIPLGSMENVITLTPFFRADILDAAAVLDVPDAVYETGVKAFWRRPVNDRYTTMLLLTPCVRSDFSTTEGAFLLPGMGLLSYQLAPGKVAVSGGAMYTGRQDFPVLPAMGLLWTPAPQWRFDIQFPSPRISYRILKDGASSETWTYVSGVFGGNTWAVTRASGVADSLTISDLRLMMGVEHLLAGNLGVFAEAGYVFSRSVEYTDVPVTRDLDSAFMLRSGITF